VFFRRRASRYGATGRAALALAAENGHTETVRALLKAGATGRGYSFLDARLPPSPRLRRTGATPRPSRFWRTGWRAGSKRLG